MDAIERAMRGEPLGVATPVSGSEDSEATNVETSDAREAFLADLEEDATSFAFEVEALSGDVALFTYYVLAGRELRIGAQRQSGLHVPAAIVEWRKRGRFAGEFKVRCRLAADAILAAGFVPEPSKDAQMPQQFACPATTKAARQVVTLLHSG